MFIYGVEDWTVSMYIIENTCAFNVIFKKIKQISKHGYLKLAINKLKIHCETVHADFRQQVSGAATTQNIHRVCFYTLLPSNQRQICTRTYLRFVMKYNRNQKKTLNLHVYHLIGRHLSRIIKTTQKRDMAHAY